MNSRSLTCALFLVAIQLVSDSWGQSDGILSPGTERDAIGASLTPSLSTAPNATTPTQAAPGTETPALGSNAGDGAQPLAPTPAIDGPSGTFNRSAPSQSNTAVPTTANSASTGQQWRFRWHDGLWWYWTPEKNWLVLQAGRWMPYQSGALYAHAATADGAGNSPKTFATTSTLGSLDVGAGAALGAAPTAGPPNRRTAGYGGYGGYGGRYFGANYGGYGPGYGGYSSYGGYGGYSGFGYGAGYSGYREYGRGCY